MNNGLAVGLAVGAGYVLGRTRKAKLALAVGTVVVCRRLDMGPRELVGVFSHPFRSIPQFKDIGDQLREDLRGVGSAAVGAVVNRQLHGLADRLRERTFDVRDRVYGAVGPGDERNSDEDLEDDLDGDFDEVHDEVHDEVLDDALDDDFDQDVDVDADEGFVGDSEQDLEDVDEEVDDDPDERDPEERDPEGLDPEGPDPEGPDPDEDGAERPTRATAPRTEQGRRPAAKEATGGGKSTSRHRTAARKTPAEKAPAKKTTTRKTAAKKTTTRKTAAKKTTTRKTAAKKTTPRKTAATKPAAEKAASSRKSASAREGRADG
ncbi:hypothetical protein [Streptomyces sp. NPDC019208]|uniref:hypothetical protein n=1 Tax=Streptomyces sp. NPDC019208 TaxID=3154683 RepID=UPI0034072F49